MHLPKTEYAMMLRTDFSDDRAWLAVCEAIREPAGEFRANVEFVSDAQFDGLTVEQLVRMTAAGYEHSTVFVVDDVTIDDPEHPILVVDVCEDPGQALRVIPDEMAGIENNLSIANMDFGDFADSVDEDGVFRGFPSESGRMLRPQPSSNAAEPGNPLRNYTIVDRMWVLACVILGVLTFAAYTNHIVPQLRPGRYPIFLFYVPVVLGTLAVYGLGCIVLRRCGVPLRKEPDIKA